MEIICPTCNKVYNIPDNKIPSNKKLSAACKKCGGKIEVTKRIDKTDKEDSGNVTLPEVKKEYNEVVVDVLPIQNTPDKQKIKSKLLINIILFLPISIAVAFGMTTAISIVLNVDFKEFFYAGTTIGFWLVGSGIPLCFTMILSGIYWFIKRKLLPGFSIILWGVFIVLNTINFIGLYLLYDK